MLKAATLAATALGLLAMPLHAQDEGEMTRGQEKLAKLLEGREAGEAKSCIRTVGSRSLTQIDGTAITYRDGDTIWVNYTRTPESIDDSDVMVIRRFSANTLCRTDHIDLVDRTGGFFRGVIMLDDFIPYTKVDSGD